MKVALEILDGLPKNDIFIIPVRLDASKASDTRLEHIQYVDLFASWKEALGAS
ncbi:MAG: hypothetical protein ACRD8Z_09905 [Nitrososphaeraceae archaeon]